MFQKLTANLKKSEQYGKKIIEELSTIGNEILKSKIEISNLEKRVEQAVREEEKLTTTLKRQSQQSSNYEYKVQKLEIRLKQYQRKLQIQQQIHDKKHSHRDSMLRKIESIQKQIKSENQSNQEQSRLKKQIEQANTRINRQSIEIQNLFHELMNKNKHLRIKEDQLQAKRKVNRKKQDRLMQLESKIHNKANKENQCTNSNVENPNEKIEKLEGRKLDADKILAQNIEVLLNMCDKFDQLAEANVGIKKQTNKDWQIFQEIKSQRNILSKLRNNKVVHQ